MSFLTMTPFISHVRAYDEPGGYENRLPFKAIVTVTHHSPEVVYLSAAHGELDPGDFPALLAMLKGQGVRTVLYERHGNMKTRVLNLITGQE